MKLSVVLATYNEEENLDRCLSAVHNIANEIIVVDGNSTDKTREIAAKFDAHVINTTNKPNFHLNKQLGLDAATGEWILLLDADEVVSPELATEILSVLALNPSQVATRNINSKKKKLFDRHQEAIEKRDGTYLKKGDIVAYFIPRLNMFLNKPLTHGGVYPDGVIRLIKNGFAKLPAKDVHEQFQINGQVSWLENDLIHFDSPTFSRYLHRANRYTSFTAQQMKTNRMPVSVGKTFEYVIAKPIFTFLSLYIRHKGFLDGVPGFIWALASGLHFPVAYFKYWELQINKQNKP